MMLTNGGSHQCTRRVAVAALVVCLLVSTARAGAPQTHASNNEGVQAKQQYSQLLQKVTGRNASGTACGPSGQTSCQAAHQDQDRSEGGVTLRSQTYSGAAEYGYKVMHHLDKIMSGIPLLDQLEEKCLQPLSESGKVSLRQSILHLSNTLVGELYALALLHKEEWMQSMLEPSLQPGEDLEAYHRYANDHFDKAYNAYEAALTVHQSLWDTMQRGASQGASTIIFTYQYRVNISSGQTSSYLMLAGMIHQRLHSGHDKTASYNAPVAYQHLEQAEAWCEQSLEELEVDIEGNRLDGAIQIDQGEEHEAAVYEAKSSMSFIQFRMGILLVDMYAWEYVLDKDGYFQLETSVFTSSSTNELDGFQVGEEQLRLLSLSITHLAKGLMLATQLTADGVGDYRLVMADSCYHCGLVFGYLQEWDDATEQLEMSISLYEDLFREYHVSSEKAATVSSRVIKATKSLWETYLNLPGKMENAKKRFLEHISFRRYAESKVEFGEPLTDDDEVEDEYTEYSNHQDNDNDARGDITIYSQYEEELETFQIMLDEYLQKTIILRMDDTSYSTHDNIYEGRLRSAIGSLYLAQDRVSEAKSELELAVGLMRGGMNGGSEYFDMYDENGENSEYSVKLELANALLSLAFVQLQVKQWKSSFNTFEEAMDMYNTELAEGESPMNNSGMGVKGVWDEAGDVEISTSPQFEEEKNLGGHHDQETGSILKEYFILDNIQIMQNVTELSRAGLF